MFHVRGYLLGLACFSVGSKMGLYKFWIIVAIVSGDTADDVYANVKDVIQDQSGPIVWIPTPDRLL